MYMTIRSLISLNIELIGPELSRVVCPWIRKFAIFDFVYTLASANIDQSIPNLATLYMPIRSWMNSIMVKIELEHPESICPWIWKNLWIWLVYTLITYKYWPISTKLGQNVCGYKMSDGFDYGFNRTRTVWVICPWICKNCWIWLCLHPSIYKCRPVSTKHGHYTYENEILDEFDYGSNLTVTSQVICPWKRKNCLIWLILHSSIYKE